MYGEESDELCELLIVSDASHLVFRGDYPRVCVKHVDCRLMTCIC